MKPTKDIERVYIEASGDSSVGIRAQHYEATMYLPKDVDEEELRDMRQLFSDLYETIAGESVNILFDFEMEEIQRQLAAMDGDKTRL